MKEHLEEMRRDTSAFEVFVAKGFKSRYTVNQKRYEIGGSATRPDLYEISSVTDYFREILYNRSDLFLKVVPLTEDECDAYDLEHEDDDCDYKQDEELAEIYNEIIAAYFLGELVYGYSQVLSLHFMTVVDWFIGLKQSVPPGEDIRPSHYQFVVSERMDISLHDYIKTVIKKKKHSEERNGCYRACLFQLFHALETAYHTNKFCHNDLHLTNVMLQRIPPESPLYQKDFLYRRLDSPNWYRVPARDLNDYIV